MDENVPTIGQANNSKRLRWIGILTFVFCVMLFIIGLNHIDNQVARPEVKVQTPSAHDPLSNLEGTWLLSIGGEEWSPLTIFSPDNGRISAEYTGTNSTGSVDGEYECSGIASPDGKIQLRCTGRQTNSEEVVYNGMRLGHQITVDGLNMSGTASIQIEGQPARENILWVGRQPGH